MNNIAYPLCDICNVEVKYNEGIIIEGRASVWIVGKNINHRRLLYNFSDKEKETCLCLDCLKNKGE